MRGRPLPAPPLPLASARVAVDMRAVPRAVTPPRPRCPGPGRHPPPDRDALRAAAARTLDDVVAPGLRILFVGINPGLYSGATGHHFARPGNRFWPTLHAAGLTPRRLTPCEERALLAHGLGVTNLVRRTTASAAELGPDELVRGGRRLARVVARLRPAIVAVLGLSTYRVAFARPGATVGPQPERLAGARVWLLPNPSGLNAHWQAPALAAAFRALADAAPPRGGRPPRRA
jgi:TDG/mug DNA glycosylase family protein